MRKTKRTPTEQQQERRKRAVELADGVREIMQALEQRLHVGLIMYETNGDLQEGMWGLVTVVRLRKLLAAIERGDKADPQEVHRERGNPNRRARDNGTGNRSGSQRGSHTN